MSDPIWTDADRASLRAAIASGQLTVSYGGGAGGSSRSVTYQSLTAMLAVLDRMNQELNRALPRYRLITLKSGL